MPLTMRRRKTDLVRPGVGKSYSLQSLFYALVLAFLLPLGGGMAFFLAAEKYDQATDPVLLMSQTQSLARSVELEFARATALLRGVSGSLNLRDGRLDQFEQEVQRIGLPAGESISVAYADPQTVAAPGYTRAGALEGAGYVTGIGPAATNLAAGGADSGHHLAVVLPLSGPVGHGPPLTLVYTMSTRHLAALLTGLSHPSGSLASILDRNRVVVASNEAPDRTGQPGPAWLGSAPPLSHQGTVKVDTGDDTRTFAWVQVPGSGFVVTLGLPNPPGYSAVTHARRIAMIIALLCFPGGIAAFVVCRRLLGGLRILSQVQGAEPGTLERVDTGVSNFNAIALATTRTLRRRDDAAAALSTLQQHMETRGAQVARADEADNDRTRHAQRLEAIGTMVSGIAHDFGNILQVLDGSIQLIRDSPGHLTTVTRSAEIMGGVLCGARSAVQRLLSFGRGDILVPEACDVRHTLNSIAEILRCALPRTIEVVVDLPADLPGMDVDRTRLEAALLNIAINAQHAMQNAGRITVTASKATRMDETLRQRDLIRVDVKDTGTGMTPATLARASEPFFTTKPVGQGTGLGLAGVRSFAEQSDGMFGISSELGHGTTVSLWLPVAVGAHPLSDARQRDPAPEASHSMARVRPDDGAPVRVLLVDDEPMIRDVLSRQLSRHGMDVTACVDTAEAVAALNGQDWYDVLLTDYAMPDMTGDVLATTAHAVRPGLPVIILTGQPHDLETAPGSAAGGVRLLCKPIGGRDLAKIINQMLERACVGA